MYRYVEQVVKVRHRNGTDSEFRPTESKRLSEMQHRLDMMQQNMETLLQSLHTLQVQMQRQSSQPATTFQALEKAVRPEEVTQAPPAQAQAQATLAPPAQVPQAPALAPAPSTANPLAVCENVAAQMKEDRKWAIINNAILAGVIFFVGILMIAFLRRSSRSEQVSGVVPVVAGK